MMEAKPTSGRRIQHRNARLATLSVIRIFFLKNMRYVDVIKANILLLCTIINIELGRERLQLDTFTNVV